MTNSLEAMLNGLSDMEIVDEIAAAYESKRRIADIAAEDCDVKEAKDALKQAMLPFKEKEAYYKKYIKTLVGLATMRGITLQVRDLEAIPEILKVSSVTINYGS
jgi:hypothetical protein